MFRNLFLIAWLLFVPTAILGVMLYNDRANPVVGGLIALVAGTSLPALFWFIDFANMYWVRQDGVEFGPMSVNKLGRLHKAGKFSGDAEVCKRWAEEWVPFALETDPAPRLSHAFVGAVLGGVLGLVAGYLMFGKVNTPLVHGLHLQTEWIVQTPVPRSDPLMVAVVRKGADVAGMSGIPIVEVLGKIVQVTDRAVQEHNEIVLRAIAHVRLSGAAGALLLAIVFGCRAREPYRLVQGQRVAAPRPKPRNTRPEASTDRIVFYCSRCGQRLAAPGRKAGQMVNCPECATRQQVPIQVT